jgi:hypothetical protein
MIRFTIRDVLWLTVVVATACAWRIDREKVKAEPYAPPEIWRQRAEASASVLREQGWKVSWKDYTVEISKVGKPNDLTVKYTHLLVPATSPADDPDCPNHDNPPENSN